MRVRAFLALLFLSVMGEPRRLERAQQRLRKGTRAVAQQGVERGLVLPWDFKVATVTATSPLTIAYADGVNLPNVARLASYSPTNGDTVLVLVRSPVSTILGEFA